MLLKIALVMLAAWLLGMAGVFRIGPAVHMFLLVSLMLLLLAVVKGRDATGGSA